MNSVIWDVKTEKIITLAKQDKRADGRKADEYRPVSIEKNISENADGSAKARIGETEVIAGVKLVPGEPYPDSPDEGTISVGAELLQLADPDFEVGPPRDNAIELARVVDRGIRESKALDFKDLCIREGELVWIAFVDFYVSNQDGNMFDTAAIAAMAALNEAKVPKLEDDKVVKGEHTGKLKLSKKPLLSTFAKVADKIFADPSLGEEKAMSSRFSCATADDNTLCAFQKGGVGSFSEKEIEQCIEVAFKRTKETRKLI
jgi:exosome complex component RRP42